MPNPNAIVSTVRRIEPSLDRPAAAMLEAEGELRVELAGERSVRLDPGDSRSPGFAEILSGLSEQGLPVYLEVDPERSTIERLLIPHVARVIGIHPAEEDALNVELGHSHAQHLLPRDTPDFEQQEKQLREALRAGDPMVVTEDDAHRIIDVRTFTPDPEGPLPPLPSPIPPWFPRPRPWWIRLLLLIWRWPLWPWWWWSWWRGCVSVTRAQEVFDAMNATSCSPLTVPSPCIPFLYPDDGCWGRAHEMCRLMIDMGLSPKKVWIQGSLRVDTRNNPNCHVRWGWHVAPTLCVRGGLLLRQSMVIDPSLFAMPVSKSEWKAVQGDPNSALTDSDASIFYLWGSETDPSYVETNAVLARYRLQLQARAVEKGPPPYANCP
jgi:glutaminase-like protein